MTRRGWVLLGLVAAVVAGAAAFRAWRAPGDDRAETAMVTVEAADESFEGCLLLADSAGEQRQGLMGVTDLGGHDGMIFEFEAAEPRAFWMRNTPMPLSIAFYDGEGRFVSGHDMDPCGDSDACPSTASAGPARYAVEVPQGRLASLGLVDGSRLERGGACEP